MPVDTGLALVMRKERTCSADATVSYLNSSHPYFNSSSRRARKRRFCSCDARASAFSYEERASGIRPNPQHRSARKN